MQIAYDLRVAIAESGEQIKREIEPLPPSRLPKHAQLSREQLKAAEDTAAATRQSAASR